MIIQHYSQPLNPALVVGQTSPKSKSIGQRLENLQTAKNVYKRSINLWQKKVGEPRLLSAVYDRISNPLKFFVTLAFMDPWLLEQENKVLSELHTRTLMIDDGTPHEVTMQELYWRWYYRIVVFETRYNEEDDPSIFDTAVRAAHKVGESIDEYFPKFIAWDVSIREEMGIDLLEPPWQPELDAAKRASKRFHDRKKERS